MRNAERPRARSCEVPDARIDPMTLSFSSSSSISSWRASVCLRWWWFATASSARPNDEKSHTNSHRCKNSHIKRLRFHVLALRAPNFQTTCRFAVLFVRPFLINNDCRAENRTRQTRSIAAPTEMSNTPTGETPKVSASAESIRDKENTSAVALIAAITAWVTIVLLVVVVGWHAFLEFSALTAGTSQNPAFFRAILLCMNGIFAMALLSMYFDRPRYELFDVWSALIIGALTILVDIYLIITELMRVFDCPPGFQRGPVANLICSDFTAQVGIVPWFSVAIILLFALGFLMLAVWYVSYRKPCAPKQVAAKRLARLRASIKSSSNIYIAVMAAAMLFIIFFCVIVAMLPVNGTFSAAFYQGTFLIIPALYAGAELAFFAMTPLSWSYLCLVFGILSLISLVIGGIFEIPRFFHCLLGTGTPSTVDNQICTTEGWLAFVLPVAIFMLVIIGATSLGFLIYRVCRPKSSNDDETTSLLVQPEGEVVSEPSEKKFSRKYK